MKLRQRQPDTAATQTLRQNRIVVIEQLLTPEAVTAIEHCLLQETPWGLAYRLDGAPTVDVQATDISGLPADIRSRLQSQLDAPFQFVYNTYMMVTAYLEQRHPGLLLNRLLEWLNSPEFLNYCRQLTGDGSITKLNAQATRYLPGHFLKNHNDHNAEEGRRYAYVLGLTRDWQADWGGLLHFTDTAGRVVRTIVPGFNTLSVFSVPQDHFVSLVAPYAKNPRLAITGWMLDK